MSTPYVLGIDVGTSAVKALLMAADGTVAGTASAEYPLSTPHPQWSEQDPEDWWRGVAMAVRSLLSDSGTDASQVVGVGLSGQMHGLVLLDEHDRPLRPAILWNDQRTGAQCDAIHERVGVERVIRLTGKPVLTGFTAPKILWVHDHEPEVLQRTSGILLPKDFVRLRLTGVRTMEVADASGTSMLDLESRDWSSEMIDALPIDRSWLPEVVESETVTGTITREAAEMTGLAAGTPVVAGAGDQAAEAIGCGIMGPGTVSVTLGTSGVVFAATERVPTDGDGRLHGYCHAIPGQWHLMGVMLAAGGSLRWYRDTLGREAIERAAREGVDAYDILTREAADIPPGAGGLLFLPYLTGERTPHPDPDARGGFVGLTVRHTHAHLTRAVLEGILFGLRDSVELARQRGMTIDRVRISGGGARSRMWRQLCADVLNAEVATVNVVQGAAYGAAILASVGAGLYATVPEAAGALVREADVMGPSNGRDVYDDIHAQYASLYPALRSSFAGLARLDQ